MKKTIVYFIFMVFPMCLVAQITEQEPYIITLKIDKAEPFFKIAFVDFHIDSIIDNRLEKTPYIGIIKKGLMGGKVLKASLEQGDIAKDLQVLFDSFVHDKEKSEPIIAKINHFRIEEYQSDMYSAVGRVFLDIDFFKKKDNILVGHYHAKFEGRPYADVTKSHDKRIFRILKNALNEVNLKGAVNVAVRQNYNDTTYIPREGFYKTYLDYIYNTPTVTKEIYTLKYAEDGKSCTIKTKLDSLNIKFFAYSDGTSVYTFHKGMWNNTYEYNKIRSKGRYLYLKNVPLDLTSDELIGKSVISSFGTAGAIAASDEKVGDAVINLASGVMTIVDSDAFLSILNKNSDIFKEYKKAEKKRAGAIQAIQSINKTYHSQ
jgi:hypothetical protein